MDGFRPPVLYTPDSVYHGQPVQQPPSTSYLASYPPQPSPYAPPNQHPGFPLGYHDWRTPAYLPPVGFSSGGQPPFCIRSQPLALARPTSHADPGIPPPVYEGLLPPPQLLGGPQPVQPLPPLPQELPPLQPEQPPLPPSVTPVAEILEEPGRRKRPSRIAVILRGIPGSGKSWAAKRIRDVEVEKGGSPPRIHSIDSYFMQEVEKEVADERGRKRKVQTEVYEHEPEMEAQYAADLLRAFRRSLIEKRHAIVVIDAPNLTAAELAEFWDAGHKAGYDVFVAEALCTDPDTCARRNIHGRSLSEVEEAARRKEPSPNMYPQLDLRGLEPGAGGRPADSAIREIDMELEAGGEAEAGPSGASSKRQRLGAKGPKLMGRRCRGGSGRRPQRG
uniref:YLP motif-containing protein 1 n=1 Tax=Tetraselmis sp. GSL018 TaxID=582737 RepID=A0A061RDX8_9CHLO